MSVAAASPVAEIVDALRSSKATWAPAIMTPVGPGWIAGTDLRIATGGPFNAILERIGERARTQDRRTVAASFALRYGWASAMAIAPYLHFRCVPDVSLDNVSFKFRESTFLEQTAIYEARGTVVASDDRAAHSMMSTVPDEAALLRTLRATLVSQCEPVVDAHRGDVARGHASTREADPRGGSRCAVSLVRIRTPRHVGDANVVLGVAVHGIVRECR